MTLTEATQRLRENRYDQTALLSFYNAFKPFIISIVEKRARDYKQLDFADLIQDLSNFLIGELLDSYDESFTEDHWRNHILSSLRNRLEDAMRHSKVEREHIPTSVEEISEESEGRGVPESLIEPGDIYRAFEQQELEEAVDRVQTQIQADSSPKSSRAQEILVTILEAKEPRDMSMRELLNQLQAEYPESKWFYKKMTNVLVYLRKQMESAGVTEQMV